MSWSSLPGRRMAGSMMSGRLVAPMMNTFFLLLIPSISVRIWLITRSAAPPGKRGGKGRGGGEEKGGKGRRRRKEERREGKKRREGVGNEREQRDLV